MSARDRLDAHDREWACHLASRSSHSERYPIWFHNDKPVFCFRADGLSKELAELLTERFPEAIRDLIEALARDERARLVQEAIEEARRTLAELSEPTQVTNSQEGDEVR